MCSQADDPTQHTHRAQHDARRAAIRARGIARQRADCQHEPTDDGTACRFCGIPAEAGTISPDALALLAAYAIADHDGIRARVGTIRADAARRHAISAARLTDDALATAAALAGIVADRRALPLNTARPASWRAVEAGRVDGDHRQPGNDLGAFARLAEAIARQREAGDVWAGAIAARADKTTHEQRYYESSDAFEERQQTSSHYRRTSWPIIRAGMDADGPYPNPARVTPTGPGHVTGLQPPRA